MSTVGAESNAVSYWIEQGNSLFIQGDYPGAINCYNKALKLGNQTNAPIFTGIVSQCGYRMDAVGMDSSTQLFSGICAAPTSIINDKLNLSQDSLTVGFDVSNPNSMHMRIGKVYINVTKYNSVINPKIIQNFGKGYNRRYSCNIKPIVGSYSCILTSKDYDFIDLAPNEMEHIVLNIDTDMPGAYELEINLDYAIGSEANNIIVGKIPGIIGFFHRNLTGEAIL